MIDQSLQQPLLCVVGGDLDAVDDGLVLEEAISSRRLPDFARGTFAGIRFAALCESVDLGSL